MYKQKRGGEHPPCYLFSSKTFSTHHMARFFFSFSSLFHRCNYNSFHLPQRDHLEYCKDCVKLETLQGTLLLWPSVSPSFVKFSHWPVDTSSAEPEVSPGDCEWWVKVKHYHDHCLLSVSISPAGTEFSWTSGLHHQPETPDFSFSGFFVLVRALSNPIRMQN